MVYQGWDSYKLREEASKLNPELRKEFESEDVEFRPAAAFIGGMNTPQYAQSKFIHQVRRPAHSNITFIRLGNNGYSYGLTEEQLGQFMCSQSLGRFYNEYLKRG